MPHLTVEYSSNVAGHHDVDALLDALHRSVLSLGIAPVPGVRIRAVARETYRIADGTNENYAFVAMTARIGPGRDAETKTMMIDTLLDAAEAQFATEPSPLIIAWSLDVQEFDPEFRVNRNHIASHMKRDSHEKDGGLT